MRFAFWQRRRPTCWHEDPDLAMARTLLCAASMRLWRHMDEQDPEIMIGALKAFDDAATTYAREVARVADEEDR